MLAAARGLSSRSRPFWWWPAVERFILMMMIVVMMDETLARRNSRQRLAEDDCLHQVPTTPRPHLLANDRCHTARFSP